MAKKPLPFPTRPLFRTPATPIVDLPAPDAIRATARAAVQAQAQAQAADVLDRVAAEDAAQKAAEEQARYNRLAAAVEKALVKGLETLGERLSDDLYNNAILANPQAFAAVYGREGVVPVPNVARPVKVYRNDFFVPVVVVGRADNDPSNDVLAVFVASGEVGPKDAQMHANDGAFSAVLRPGQTLFASVRVTTGTTASIIFTVIPLRGRAAVFGG